MQEMVIIIIIMLMRREGRETREEEKKEEEGVGRSHRARRHPLSLLLSCSLAPDI